MENQKITAALADFIGYMSMNLSDDVEKRIVEMAENEKEQGAKEIYASMLKNMEAAKTLGRPICQDTGIIQLFVKIGTGFKHLDKLNEALVEAVRKASAETPLRPNAVLPFIDKNTGNNIGPGSPCIYYELVSDSDELEIEVYCAGGGCSLPGFSAVLFPSEGIEGVVRRIVDMVIDRGVNACPPLIVGVGIGTCADSAALLSKKALIRPVGTVNPEENAAKLEKELFDKLSHIGFGPNGLGGSESVLGVNVETSCHHPATLAMGVSFGCWASRHGGIIFDNELNAKSVSHKNWEVKNG